MFCLIGGFCSLYLLGFGSLALSPCTGPAGGQLRFWVLFVLSSSHVTPQRPRPYPFSTFFTEAAHRDLKKASLIFGLMNWGRVPLTKLEQCASIRAYFYFYCFRSLLVCVAFSQARDRLASCGIAGPRHTQKSQYVTPPGALYLQRR